MEELEHPSYSSTGECRVIETADTTCTSLVHKPGRMGNEPSKIRALKQGIGIKINPYDKVVEIRSNLSNKPGLNHKIFDTASQTFKQLQSGDGINIIDTVDSVILQSTMKAQSCESDSSSAKIVDSVGKIKTISVDGGIFLEDTDDKIKFSAMDIIGGHGIKVDKKNNCATISAIKELQEYACSSEGVVSLFDAKHYALRRLNFPSSDFEVVHEDKVTTITPKQKLKSRVTHPNAISMLDGVDIKCLVPGAGCRLREKQNGIFIDVLKPNLSDELMQIISSTTLSLKHTKGKVEIDVPSFELQNVGNGIHVLEGRSIKTLKGGSGCRIVDKENTIEILCENPPLTNALSSVGSLIKNGKVRVIEGLENIKITGTPDSVRISCPMKFAANGWPLAIPTDEGVEYLGIKGVGGCKIKRFDKVIEISTEQLKQANSPVGTVGMITGTREIKALCGGALLN